MKIIFSIASLGSGGAERVLSILSAPMADSFDSVHFVMWEGGKPFYHVDERVKLVSLPSLSGRVGRTRQISTFRRYIKKERPDLIVSFLTPYNILTLVSTLGIRQKIVVAERTDPKRLFSGGRPMLLFRDIMYRRAYGILTQTEYAKSCYDVRFSGKTKVIYNPVLMSENQVGLALRSTKKKCFVTVGRLEPVKNQKMIIEAFYDFHKSHPDYQLVFYGEGPERKSLEQLIVGKGLTSFVTLAGKKEKVWDEMAYADCFLLSSNYEGMSNAMIEAMCLGLPVISTKVAGATDLIREGENGFLVDINDSSQMSHYLSRIADDNELRIRMGNEAVKVYDMLRSDKISQQWIAYLKDCAY